MKTKVLLIIAVALLVWGLAVARDNSAVTTIRMEKDQIAKIVTAPGIVSRLSFPEEVQEIICGDLYDSTNSTGSFVVQRSGNDVFVKPVVAKGMSNLFVKTGDGGDTTYGFDLEIGQADKAQRVVNIIDARPSAVRNRLKRVNRISASTLPVTMPVSLNNSTANILPQWVASLLNISSAPMPEPPVVEETSEIQVPRQALSRVAADYPEMARRVGARGEVTVEVEIDSSGKVTSAKAISGPLLLRTSAIQAARLWKFTPAAQGAEEQRTVAKITFDFQISSNLFGNYVYSIAGGTPVEQRRQ